MLEEGKHVYLSCSNCRAMLVDLWVNQPDAKDSDGKPYHWKAKANCCFCSDSSWEKEFEGLFYPGGYGESKEDDSDDSIMSTRIDDTNMNGENLTFKVVKYQKDSKPFYAKD